MGGCCCKEDLGKKIPRNAAVDCSVLTASKAPIICLIGGPGCGKKTLSERLVGKYGLVAVNISDLMRAEVSSGSERGEIIKRIMTEGQNLPADVVVQKVEEKMANVPEASGYLLVGFPREKKQCKLFDKDVRQPNLLLYLWARRQIVEDRMRSRSLTHERFDDAEEIIVRRIKTFFYTVGGVVGSYGKIKANIDAERSEEEVFHQTCMAIDAMLAKLTP